MDKTDNLNIPYILPSQAQKHVTHNEAIRALDAMLHLAVLSRAVTTPPENPTGGDRYIVPSGATGAWSGRETSVAAWQDGAWAFYAPREGWLAHVLDENRMLVFKAGGWTAAAFAVAIPDQVGINTSADATNRLAVAAPASLFTNTGAGHQLKINKATVGDTASLLYQTAWSGRAEMGLAGNDAFSIKVSADGATFRQAIVIDPATGRPAFPSGAQGLREQLTADRTYHVAPAGSDGNDGLSTSAPFATLQKAIDTALALDCARHDVAIQLADGTHAGASVSRPLLGNGRLTIRGNETTPASVVLTGGLSFANGVHAKVSGLRITITTDLIHALSVGNGVTLRIGRMEFGAVGANADHIFCDNPCKILLEDNYTITGGARRHMNIGGGGSLSGTGRTFTLTGTPAFTQFAATSHCGTIALSSAIVVGSATGSRYIADTNGVINTFGKATTFLPGSTAGTNPAGGIYA
ncbi:DUF2793 domain-containing protein [Shinella sp. AETb1-6]|uniref:DUF2793 domain-containing protein n=1 Tax=Shinella sp. AETb1-6 TaxID=2692210 RepID=UPI0013693778|nr:DUF2793 domain-containing protein [Shinella sp. AETb1-6]MXN54010.1 DUF2793 domain-containing protein [Shinella sp. AETb1-6]